MIIVNKDCEYRMENVLYQKEDDTTGNSANTF
jgi:hypothetical protein